MLKELEDLKLILKKAGPYYITNAETREEQKERYDAVVTLVNEFAPIIKKLDRNNLSIDDLKELLNELKQDDKDRE